MKQPRNFPRDEIMRMADKAIREAGGPDRAQVFFKFACTSCGERVEFQEPNKLYERGECCNCGLDQPVNEAGFSLLLNLKPTKGHHDET